MSCKICGAKSGIYPLCPDCFKLRDQGKIQKCENCGEWHYTVNPCKCESKRTIVKNLPQDAETENSKCIICGLDSNGKEVCKFCYSEILTKEEEIDKNLRPWELKDYFYNLNSSIYRVKENNYALGQIYKLFAIAWILKNLHKDTQLSDIVGAYAKKIIEKRRTEQDFKITEEKERTDKDTVAVTNPKNRASDGHICKSKGEVDIDNILYKYNICHAYGLKVKEIPSSKERTVVADWFIPLGGTKGIYIEYWGMDNQDYQDNKQEKLALYEKYKDKVKLIEIDKNDINDIQTLETNLYQKLVDLGWNDPN